MLQDAALPLSWQTGEENLLGLFLVQSQEDCTTCPLYSPCSRFTKSAETWKHQSLPLPSHQVRLSHQILPRQCTQYICEWNSPHFVKLFDLLRSTALLVPVDYNLKFCVRTASYLVVTVVLFLLKLRCLKTLVYGLKVSEVQWSQWRSKAKRGVEYPPCFSNFFSQS